LDSLDIEREQVDVASGKGMGYKYFGAAKQMQITMGIGMMKMASSRNWSK
jgi:hypothetical protein